jgi:hypothetical protein
VVGITGEVGGRRSVRDRAKKMLKTREVGQVGSGGFEGVERQLTLGDVIPIPHFPAVRSVSTFLTPDRLKYINVRRVTILLATQLLQNTRLLSGVRQILNGSEHMCIARHNH